MPPSAGITGAFTSGSGYIVAVGSATTGIISLIGTTGNATSGITVVGSITVVESI